MWNHPIAVFRAPVRQVSPAGRAARAAKRIEEIPADVRPDEIRADVATLGDLNGVLVFARNQILFGIVPEDLDPSAGETLESVGRQAVDQLRAVLQARADQRRLPVLLRGLGLSVGATALLALVLWVVGHAAARALARVAEATRPRATLLVGVDLWPFLHAAERTLVTVTAWSVSLVAVYLWLTFILYQFPYTRPWGSQLGVYVVDLLRELGTGALHAIPGLFAVVLIFLVTRFVVRLVDALFRGIETGSVTIRGLQPDTAGATRRIVGVLIWIFALTVAYQYIPGSESDAFKAVGVFAGLMISLGSAGLVNQVMSGLVMVYARALRPGELVRAGEVIGVVSEVSLLSTKVVTPKREEVTIPNAVLAGTMITNYSRLADENGAIISTAVTIGYDAPWRQVHALLLLAAERTPGLRSAPRPYVLQTALADFYAVRAARAPPGPGGAISGPVGPARADPGRLQRIRRADHVPPLRGATRAPRGRPAPAWYTAPAAPAVPPVPFAADDGKAGAARRPTADEQPNEKTIAAPQRARCASELKRS